MRSPSFTLPPCPSIPTGVPNRALVFDFLVCPIHIGKETLLLGAHAQSIGGDKVLDRDTASIKDMDHVRRVADDWVLWIDQEVSSKWVSVGDKVFPFPQVQEDGVFQGIWTRLKDITHTVWDGVISSKRTLCWNLVQQIQFIHRSRFVKLHLPLFNQLLIDVLPVLFLH